MSVPRPPLVVPTGPRDVHEEHRAATPLEPLFTIIMLGEVVLSTVFAVQEALAGEYAADLSALVVGSLLVVFALWWIYVKGDHAPLFASERAVFKAA